MANTFKNSFASAVGTSAVSVYTCPAATQSTIIGLSIGNITNSPITCDVYVTSSATNYYMVKTATVPVGGALVPIGGDQKLVLEVGDILKVASSVASSADVIVSYLEIT